MILSAGLSPAWQQTLCFEQFECGEVNRASRVDWSASGKVFNVAIALRQWASDKSGSVVTVAPVGGLAGGAIADDLKRWGIDARLIETESATRICTTVLDTGRETMTELVENGRPLTLAELDSFRAVFRQQAALAEVVVLIGSLPVGVESGFYGQLLDGVQVPAILDFQGEPLLDSLRRQPFLVKPNRDELGWTLGRPLDTDSHVLDAMRELVDRGAESVLVTDGPGPLWLVCPDGDYRFIPPVVERPISPLGSGDTLAATIAWGKADGRADGRTLVETVRLGVAAAADNLNHWLPARFDPDKARELAEAVVVERV
jgi:tagatose 6-phosphate kinase